MEFDRAAVTKERAAGAMTGRAGSKKGSIRRFARKKRLRILYFQIYSVHLHHQNGLCRDGTGESVAQQVEHNTFNVGVLGSSPSGFTPYLDKSGQKLAKSHNIRVLWDFFIASVRQIRTQNSHILTEFCDQFVTDFYFPILGHKKSQIGSILSQFVCVLYSSFLTIYNNFTT